MWLEILTNMNKLKNEDENFNYLNLRFDLHIAIYIIEILKNKYTFHLSNDKLVIRDSKENVIDNDKFFYWWQIERYKEVYKEEVEIFNRLKEVELSIQKLSKSIENIKEKDLVKKQKKIEEYETKIVKLTNYLNKENPIVKNKLSILSNFRNMFNTREIFEKILEFIQIYLSYSE